VAKKSSDTFNSRRGLLFFCFISSALHTVSLHKRKRGCDGPSRRTRERARGKRMQIEVTKKQRKKPAMLVCVADPKKKNTNQQKQTVRVGENC